MDETRKSLREWEEEKGQFVRDPSVDETQMMTEAEYDAIPRGEKHGVMYNDRVQFLTEHNYPVTRQNLMEHRLSAGHIVAVNGKFVDYDDWDKAGRPDTMTEETNGEEQAA